MKINTGEHFPIYCNKVDVKYILVSKHVIKTALNDLTTTDSPVLPSISRARGWAAMGMIECHLCLIA